MGDTVARARREKRCSRLRELVEVRRSRLNSIACTMGRDAAEGGHAADPAWRCARAPGTSFACCVVLSECLCLLTGAREFASSAGCGCRERAETGGRDQHSERARSGGARSVC
eukprot:3521871-Pleurochrysis_carterae.AAC.1